jgi:MFS family permease
MTEGAEERGAELATDWRIIAMACAAGVIAAAHIGKLPPALPLIRAELGAGLVMAGWIASTISAVGCLFGLTAGGLTDRLGQRTVMVYGLVVLALGGVLGALAPDGIVMLVSRFIEGVGFTAISVAGGAIVARAAAPGDRNQALGIWAVYMPLGFAGMMLVSGVTVDILGWRAEWLALAALALVFAGIFALHARGWGDRFALFADRQSVAGNIALGLRNWGGLAMAACFALYAAQHISMMNWLPTYLIEAYGAGTAFAAAVPATVLIFNGLGNLLAGAVLARGAPVWTVLAIGAAGMGLCELGMFAGFIPELYRFALALVFGLLGGLVPAAALAAAPVYARTPALYGTLSGVIVMGSNVGQWFGPPALAAARLQAGSWEGTAWLFMTLAAAGVIIALVTIPLERRMR